MPDGLAMAADGGDLAGTSAAGFQQVGHHLSIAIGKLIGGELAAFDFIAADRIQRQQLAAQVGAERYAGETENLGRCSGEVGEDGVSTVERGARHDADV